MRDADHAHPCGKGIVLALPGVTPCNRMQPGATAPAISQNEPTAADRFRKAPMPENARFCPTPPGIWKNEPTVEFAVVTAGPTGV